MIFDKKLNLLPFFRVKVELFEHFFLTSEKIFVTVRANNVIKAHDDDHLYIKRQSKSLFNTS